MSSETRGEKYVPATALRCRHCESEYALEAIGVCSRCFAPLEPLYDRERLARLTRESIASGPLSIWRYSELLPVERPEQPRLAPGFTPLQPAPRLAAEIRV